MKDQAGGVGLHDLPLGLVRGIILDQLERRVHTHRV